MLLEVIDDGVGIETEKVKALLKGRGDDKSVGLTNVNRRLVNLYGKDYQLAVESMINGGTSVKIRIPSIISRG